jgi:hypothetical protein
MAEMGGAAEGLTDLGIWMAYTCMFDCVGTMIGTGLLLPLQVTLFQSAQVCKFSRLSCT